MAQGYLYLTNKTDKIWPKASKNYSNFLSF